jgi:hypothetical protein
MAADAYPVVKACYVPHTASSGEEARHQIVETLGRRPETNIPACRSTICHTNGHVVHEAVSEQCPPARWDEYETS